MAEDAASLPDEITVRTSKWRFLYFIFCYPAWRKRTWTASKSGIVAKSGILSRNETRIPWSRVTDKSIHQGIFGRIFNFGDIKLETAGNDRGSDMVLTKVGNAEEFYEVICQRCDAAYGNDAS